MQAIWIEIPVSDLERAKAVFEHAPTEVVDDGTRRITIIPGEPTVSLNQAPGFTPGPQGALPYFALVADLDGNLLYLHGTA